MGKVSNISMIPKFAKFKAEDKVLISLTKDIVP